MELLSKKNIELETPQNIFEKKKTSIKTKQSVKDFFKNSETITPFYFNGKQPIKKVNSFINIIKSNIQKLNSDYKLKIMISNSVSESIKNNKWDDINEYIASGYPLSYHQRQSIKEKIKKKDDYLSFSRRTTLHDIFLYHAFTNSSFQIYTRNTFNFLIKNFPHEIVPVSVVDNFNERSNYNNKLYYYKGIKLNDLGYDKDNIISSLNVHNSLINPSVSIPLFSCILHRAVNHSIYSYESLECSIIQPLSFLAIYRTSLIQR